MLAKTNKSIGPIDVFTQFSGKLQRGTLASWNYIQLSGFGFKKIRILHWGNEEQH